MVLLLWLSTLSLGLWADATLLLAASILLLFFRRSIINLIVIARLGPWLLYVGNLSASMSFAFFSVLDCRLAVIFSAF